MANWLFLRGLGREARHWGDLPQHWQDHVAASKVDCQDIPGNGSLWQHRSPVHIQTLLEWLHGRWGDRHEQQPLYLLGLSLGGMIAYHWMQRYPQDISGVVMINSSLAPFSNWRQRLQPQALRTLMQALRASGYEREARIYDLTCANMEHREQTLAQWQLYQQQCPVSRSNLVRQLILANSCRADSEPPRRPLLLINGQQDRLVDPVSSELLARQWLVPLLNHPEAGHDLPHDEPEWLLQQVSAWTQSLQ